MLDPLLKTRFNELVEVKKAERRRQFPDDLTRIDRQASARGLLGWSGRAFQHKQAHERELEVRTILAWESMVRVHRTLGCPMSATLREDVKTEMHMQIESIFVELSGSLEETLRHRRGQPQAPVQASPSLSKARLATLAKHDIEIDLYVDFLLQSQAPEGGHPMAQNYNFYGNVGSVQTGANAVANNVQNLGEIDRAALVAAIREVREAILGTPTLGEQERRELVEITDDCEAQMSAASPNNTKLLTMLNTLGTTIQSLACVQPACQALKNALIPLGIILP